MEQKDFILREIEKIGLLLQAILGNLFGKSKNLAITIKYDFEKTNEQLFEETGFDLNNFLTLDELEINDYLTQIKGFNVVNLELLAEILFQLSIEQKSENKQVFLEKALQLYNLCERTDKTYSFDREAKIIRIKNAME